MSRSAIDYKVGVRSAAEQEMVVEMIDFGIRHRVFCDERSVALAKRIIQRFVRTMLTRKRLTDEERQQIAERWKEYAA